MIKQPYRKCTFFFTLGCFYSAYTAVIGTPTCCSTGSPAVFRHDILTEVELNIQSRLNLGTEVLPFVFTQHRPDIQDYSTCVKGASVKRNAIMIIS